jgi:hypothetical protein
VVQYSVEIPNRSHIKKIVCSGGITVYGHTVRYEPFVALAMSWQHSIVLIGAPYGRTLNIQAGAMTMNQAVIYGQPDGDISGTTVIGTGAPPSQSTTYTGNIQQIDQDTSYGSVGRDDGLHTVEVTFSIIGVHGVDGGPDPPWYQWSGAMHLGVLYEQLV